MKRTLLAFAIMSQIATLSYAQDPQMATDREAVNNACSAEAATAGCGSEKVGTGLLRCIFAYKKSHKKDFKISDSCKASMKKLREDHLEKKNK